MWSVSCEGNGSTPRPLPAGNPFRLLPADRAPYVLLRRAQTVSFSRIGVSNFVGFSNTYESVWTHFIAKYVII